MSKLLRGSASPVTTRHLIIWRLVAGLLAGASIVVGLLLMLLPALASWGIVSLLWAFVVRDPARAPFWRTLGQSILLTLDSLPGFVWSTRWMMLVTGVFGAGLALVDGWRDRVQRPWRDSLGVVAAFGVWSAVVIGALYPYEAAIQSAIADQPGVFYLQAVLLLPEPVLLGLATLIAGALAFVTWRAWSFWYDFWAARLRIQRPAFDRDASVPPDDYQWREYQERAIWLHTSPPEVERPWPTLVVLPRPVPRHFAGAFGVVLVLAPLLAFALLALYHRAGPQMVSGEVWLNGETPRVSVSLPLTAAPRRIVVSFPSGAGMVDLRLTNGAGQSLKSETLEFPRAVDQYRSVDIDVGDQAPGTEQLTLTLERGQGGVAHYVALYGGGLGALLASATLGLVGGLWLATALIVVFELMVKGSWI